MTKYREILRLTALGLSQRNIIQSIGVSQKTIVKVQKRAQEMHLSWPANVKHFFTLLGKKIFTRYGNQFFTSSGKEFFTSYGKKIFTSPAR